MLLLVDGYNVTRSDPSTKHLSVEGQRDALVRRLRARGREMLGAGTIVVYFDGATGTAVASAGSCDPVRVVYAREGSADDAIVAAAQASSERVTVVTNDRELAARVKTHATGETEVLPASAAWEEAGRGSSRKGKRPAPRRDSGLPNGANKITEELKKLWLTGDDE